MEALRGFLQVFLPLLLLAIVVLMAWNSGRGDRDDDDFPGGTPA